MCTGIQSHHCVGAEDLAYTYSEAGEYSCHEASRGRGRTSHVGACIYYARSIGGQSFQQHDLSILIVCPNLLNNHLQGIRTDRRSQFCTRGLQTFLSPLEVLSPHLLLRIFCHPNSTLLARGLHAHKSEVKGFVSTLYETRIYFLGHVIRKAFIRNWKQDFSTALGLC